MCNCRLRVHTDGTYDSCLWRGTALIPDNDNFNFYASQVRICSEMGFGLMKEKMGILQKPLSIYLRKIRVLMPVVARLHNFCINERLLSGHAPRQSSETNGFSIYEQAVRQVAAEGQFQEQLSHEFPQWSLNRDNMVTRVKSKGLVRPSRNSRQDNHT